MKNSSILAAFFAAILLAAPQAARAQQPYVTDDEVKVNTYKKFVDNRVPNPAAAYEAARDYMARYGKEDDQYTRYLKNWIAAYEEDVRVARLAAERADREQQLLGSFTTKDYAKAYGLAKPVLADDANNLRVLIALGYGAGGEARQPLGLVVVGGLLFSQLVTLYLTPVFYTYMARLQTWLKHRATAQTFASAAAGTHGPSV